MKEKLGEEVMEVKIEEEGGHDEKEEKDKEKEKSPEKN